MNARIYIKLRGQAPAFAALLLLAGAAPAFSFLPPSPATAAWVGGTTGDPVNWNNTSNWTPNGVPNSTTAQANFASGAVNFTPTITGVTINVGSAVFAAGAPAYIVTIVATGGTAGNLVFNGAGIVNNSSATQTFVVSGGGGTGGNLVFLNSSTAANATIFNTGSPSIVATGTNSSGVEIDLNSSVFAGSGFTYFDNNSSGGAAQIINVNGGSTNFFGNSTAGSAQITNSLGGNTYFGANSSAGSATITNAAGGYTVFIEQSTATNATSIINKAGGFVDISTLTTGGISIGQITGAGNIYLGANNLTVGGQGANATISGVISDGTFPGNFFELPPKLTGGSLTKVGGGLLDLTGANTYTGNTIVAGGALWVDGSIASPTTTVYAGALLGGHGVIGGNVVNNGVLSPGNSPGTLSINGNYTQGATGALLIEVGGLAPNQHDLLRVGGSARLGGALVLESLNGFKFNGAGQALTFLSAVGGESGRFSSIQGASGLNGVLNGTKLVYLPNALVLESTQGSVYTAVGGNPGITWNDRETAKILDSAASDPRAANLFSTLDKATLGQLTRDVELVDPGQLAVLSNIGPALDNTLLLQVTQRFDAIHGAPPTPGPYGPAGPDGKGGKEVMPPPANNRWGFWSTGSGDFERVEDTSSSRGFNFGSGGFTLGVDYRFTDHFVAGLFGGYTNTDIDIANGGRINVNAGKWGLYGTYFDGGFYVNSAAEGGYTSYDNHRDALGGTARSSADGGDVSLLFAPGYNWTMGGLTFGPTARFQYTYQSTDGFSESGSLAPMSVGSQHTESIVTAVGMKASYDWKCGTMIFRPELRLEWEHEYGDTATGIDAQLASDAGNAFRLATPTIGRDDFHLGAGCALVISDRITAYAYYDGQFFRVNYDASTVTAGFRVSF
jgi:outer membrane autotransporter protein